MGAQSEPQWAFSRASQPIENGPEFLKILNRQSLHRPQRVLVAAHGAPSNDYLHLGGKHLPEPLQLTLYSRVVFGINQAQGYCTGTELPGGSSDFGSRQAGAEIRDAPAQIGCDCSDD
jgi:hypothetical protein